MLTIPHEAVLEYLEQCGGSDILVFEDSQAASDAAWDLRAQWEGLPVRVRSSYNKVFIEQGGAEL